MFDAAQIPQKQRDATLSIRPVACSRAKRAADVLVSAALVVLLLPLFIGISVGIILDSPGPVLFCQRRTGLNGRVFKIYKFRTMTVLEDHLDLSHAMRDDVRVTRCGRFLRRASLDELPQFFNILKGEMSLVGPRPHAVGHDSRYALLIPGYWDRFQAKPGLTGSAQIAGMRGDISGPDAMAQRVGQDLRYIEQWSLRLDIEIALKTVPLLLCGTNAY